VLAVVLTVWAGGRARAEDTLSVDGKGFRVERVVKRGTYDLVWPIRQPPAESRSVPLELAFLFAARGDKDFYRISLRSDGWRVERCTGGITTLLERKAGPVVLDSAGEFTLRRRLNWLSGIWAGRVLFRVFDTASGEGQAASWSALPDLVGPPHFQAVAEGEMALRDDFLRAPGDKVEGVWEVAGSWKLQSSADEWRGDSPLETMNTARNANPFVYRGAGQPRATALAGLPFWDDLAGAVSVRSQGGRAGWVFSYRAADDFYVLWWEPTGRWEQPCRLALERVRGGKQEVLAETRVMGKREQWYRLGVEVRGAEITARLQGAVLLRATDPTCLGGRFGLCAADGEVDFDDVEVHRAELRPFEEPWFRKRAETAPLGDWSWSAAGAARRATGQRGDAALTLATAGLQARRLAVSVSAPKGRSATIGLRLGSVDDQELTFLWESADHAFAERRLVAGPGYRGQVLARARGGFMPGTTLRLLVELADDELRISELSAGLILRAPKVRPDLQRLGLVALAASACRFDDVVIDGADERDWEKPVETAVFVTDHYMLEWAAAEGQWVPDATAAATEPPRWWHKSDFFGALELDVPLSAARQSGGVKVFFLAGETRPESGYELALSPQDSGSGASALTATLSWRGRRLASAEFRPPPRATTLELHRDGSFFWLRCGAAEPIFLQLREDSLQGTCVGIELPDPRWLAGVQVRRDHVVDDQFGEVPTRWRTQGRWEVSNKFHCDPRWAYMVGESDGLAALWHLDSFPGDLTLEFYAGMRYRAQFDFMPYYPRPGDLNAVIASSGDSVWDGYTAVVSGWETAWTRLLRDGQIVAETGEPLVPSTRKTYCRPQDLHRRWFYVKLRRVGPRLELYFENQKVLSWDDPDPALNGRLALWTVDNSILIARAKISYRRKDRFVPAVVASLPPRLPAQPPAAETLRLASETHPGCRFSFDAPGDLEGWQETGSADDARLSWDSRESGVGHGSLRVTNGCPGGRFMATVPVKGLELRRASRLSFACRMDPAVKVNLYLRAGGTSYVIRMTGPEASDETLQSLGQIAVQPERGWQRLEFPLGEALTEKRPADPSLVIEDLHFGVQGGEYLLAGLGGNPGGAYFLLDDFEIASEGSGDCRIRITDGTGTSCAAGTYSIIHSRAREPAGDPLPSRAREQAESPSSAVGTAVCTDKAFSAGAVAETLPPGTYLVTAKRQGGAAEASLRLHVGAPLAVAALTPDAGAAWGGDQVTIRFAAGPPVPTWGLEFTAGGKSFPVDGTALSYSQKKRLLTFSAAAAGLALREGEPCAFALRTKVPATATLKEWALTYRRSEDHTPPGPVRVQEAVIHDTFETDLGAWTRIGRDAKGREHGALLVRDPSTAASGRYSLKLFNELVGGVAGAQITAQSFHAGRQPLLSFDCRMTEEMLVDLLLVARGMESRIVLTDNDYLNSAWPLGYLDPGVWPDGRWQHLEVNLHDLIQASPYVAGQFEVSNLRLGDGGWQGNRQGGAFWIDNFSLGACVGSVGDGVALSWKAEDPGGVAGYSYHWSREPHQPAATTAAIEAPGARFRNLPEGKVFLHIRAVDGAGNWGETSDWPFLVDNTPPRVRKCLPAADSQAADRMVDVAIEDPRPTAAPHDSSAGIDPASLVLTINGRAFTPGQPGVELYLRPGRFRVDWVTAGLLTTPPPEGQVFEVTLGPMKDFAGNVSAPVAWKWRFSAKGDRLAPLAPVITWVNGAVALQMSMETEQPVLSASPPVWLDRILDLSHGTHVQQVRLGGSGVDLRVALPGSIDAAAHRWFSFRYHFPAGLKIDLAGYLQDPNPEKQQMVIKLTDAEVRPDYVNRAGRVEGIVRGSGWHAAIVDLKAQVESRESLKEGEKPQSYAISALSFADVGFNRQRPGTVFYLDDLLVAAPGPAAASFGLSATDESGVAGFACSFDRDPDGTPPLEANVKPGAAFAVTFPDKGLWYVHACAQDGAGNWSKPGHFAYVVE
jgi:hypothetical protein